MMLIKRVVLFNPLSPWGEGWGEGVGSVNLQKSTPSSPPSGDLLPKGRRT